MGLFQVPTYQKYLVKTENASNEPTAIVNSLRNLCIILMERQYYDDIKINRSDMPHAAHSDKPYSPKQPQQLQNSHPTQACD